MITNPIIPIPAMILISIVFLLLIMKNRNKYSIIKRILIIVLIFIINLRIMIMSQNVEVAINNLDVLFVIDNTISMVAEDYEGKTERLAAVKEDCRYIIDELSGAKFSVVTFNNKSRIVIPYTKDANLAMEAIETIKVMDELYAEGSSMNIVIDDLISSLEASNKKTDRIRIVFFISDGEITNEDKLESFEEAEKYIHNGAVLGYGTKQGGNMKVTNTWSDTSSYIEDRSEWPYVNALSKIDERNLKRIAEDMGINYINMEKQSNIDYKLKEIKEELLKNIDSEDKELYTDTYYIFVVPLCLLLIYELINHKRRFFA